MNNKEIYKEIIIVFVVLILLFMSIGISLFQDQDETIYENKKTSISYSPYRTLNAPMITLSGSERNDICDLAKKQAGVQEDGSPGDGYTPYHRWAASSAATQFGAQYGTQWYTKSIFYNYWCVLFVNWCAYNAGVDGWSNYPMSCTSNSDAKTWYANKGRISYNRSDGAIEKGWVYIASGHMRLFVGGGEWVDGNSFDGSEPAYYYVSYNKRSRSNFDAYGKPYYRAKIIYNTNGGNAIADGKYTEETTNVTLPTPTKSGSKFLGWYTNSGFTSSSYTTSQAGWRGNKPLYAKWEAEVVDMKITYVMNGGSWNGAAGASTYRVGTGYTLPTNVVKGNGSTFNGWYTDSGCNNKITAISKDAKTNITVYAGYTAPIVYETYNGTWSSNPIGTYTEKHETKLPTNVTRSKCTFAGWFYNSTLSSRVTSNGKSDYIPTTAQGRIYVYARWSATLKFHSRIGFFTGEKVNGDNGGPTRSMTYYPGTGESYPGISNGTSLLTSNDVYEPWCTFAGWHTVWRVNENYGPFYKIGDKVTNSVFPNGYWPWTGGMTLYARFIGKNYKIYLHGNKGNTSDTGWTLSGTYDYYKDYQYRYQNNRYALPTKDTMYRRGYTFQGWYDNEYFNGNPVTATDKNTGGDKHYYAKWEPNKYPLILYSERGKVTDTSYTFTDMGNYLYRYNKLYTYDTYVPLPTQPATVDRRGHSFDGWFREKDYSGSSVSQLVPGDIETQTFYAKWTPITYQLVLHNNGATIVNPCIDNGHVVGDDTVGTYTYAKGSTFPKVDNNGVNSDMYKDGSIFSGWYDQANLSGNRVEGIRSGDDDTAPIGDREYWARWITVQPSATNNTTTDVINGELVVYLYSMSIIKVSPAGILAFRQDKALATDKRKFSMDITVDGGVTTQQKISVWLQSEKEDANATKLKWNMTTNSSYHQYNSSTGIHTLNDNCTITFECPSNVVDSYLGERGSKKVYLNVLTESGNRGSIAINLVKRVTYEMH